MASLFLIRHAEPAQSGVLLGQMDPPASKAGLAAASLRLSGIRAAAVWTSPLQRARRTAALLPCPDLREVPDLREIDTGAWTGLSWSAIESQWPVLAARKLADWLAVTPPEGEPWPAFLGRVAAAWERIRQGPEPAAIVAHQGVNAALRYLIRGEDPLICQQGYGESIPLVYHR